MGMAFQNKRGEWFECRCAAWKLTLILAESYGWNPAGTLPPLREDGSEPEDLFIIAAEHPARLLSYCRFYIKRLTNCVSGYWDSSNYTTGDGQRVTDADACALAEVLLRVRARVRATEIGDRYRGDPEKWFDDFIAYFQKGGFSIH